MSIVGQREILTQRRVVTFFQDVLGYAYLGDWRDRLNHRSVTTAVVILSRPQGKNHGRRSRASFSPGAFY